MKSARIVCFGSLAFASLLAAGCGSDDTEITVDSGADVDASDLDAAAGSTDAADPDADPDAECESASDCDDEIACTVGSCSAEGECSFEPEDALCDDQNECTINTCDGEQGCQVENVENGESCAGGEGTCQEGVCQGEAAQTAGFRLSSIVLEHPHVIVDTVVEHDFFGEIDICEDVTDDDLEVFGTHVADGLNPTLAQQIEELELNVVNVVDPFTQQDEDIGQSTLWAAECTSPTECEPETGGELHAAAFTVDRVDSCLGVIPDLFEGEWPDGNTSAPNQTPAGDHGCYVTETERLELAIELAGERIVLPLNDARFASRFGGEPAGTIEDGVIVGFLTEEEADGIEIEVDTDVGPVTLNLGQDLLPDNPDDGVASGCDAREHCAGPDARAIHSIDDEDECGWWFVFNVRGERISDASPF